jgi:hypothetical protein
MSVINSYQTGTTFTDSITSGVFGQIGNATTGVPTGVPLLYAWKPISGRAILSSPDTNPNFASANGAYINFNRNKLATPFTVIDLEVPLDCCRIILITANQEFNVFASVRDFYGEPMTFGGTSQEIQGIQSFIAPRGVSAINSIKVSGSAGLTNVRVFTMDIIELPFSNFNEAPPSFVSFKGFPLYGIYNEGSTPYKLKPLFSLVNSVKASDQTLSEGSVRPLFAFEVVEGITTNSFDGESILIIGQNVAGFGYNIPLTDQTIAIAEDGDFQPTPFLNSKEYVIGGASYSKGWKGWQS